MALRTAFRLASGKEIPAVGLGTCTASGAAPSPPRTAPPRPAPHRPAPHRTNTRAPPRRPPRFLPHKGSPTAPTWPPRSGPRSRPATATLTARPCVRGRELPALALVGARAGADPRACVADEVAELTTDGNEAAVGEVYASVFGSGARQRSDVFIVSKLWNSAHHPERVRSAFEKTLSVHTRARVHSLRPTTVAHPTSRERVLRSPRFPGPALGVP